jgi:hypothetical protein
MYSMQEGAVGTCVGACHGSSLLALEKGMWPTMTMCAAPCPQILLQLFPQPAFRNVALQCLTEVGRAAGEQPH